MDDTAEHEDAEDSTEGQTLPPAPLDPTLSTLPTDTHQPLSFAQQEALMALLAGPNLVHYDLVAQHLDAALAGAGFEVDEHHPTSLGLMCFYLAENIEKGQEPGDAIPWYRRCVRLYMFVTTQLHTRLVEAEKAVGSTPPRPPATTNRRAARRERKRKHH
jgi:hypothetical protein